MKKHSIFALLVLAMSFAFVLLLTLSEHPPPAVAASPTTKCAPRAKPKLFARLYSQFLQTIIQQLDPLAGKVGKGII